MAADVAAALVSANVRRDVRELLVGWTLAEIGDVFHGHGFSADTGYDPPMSGQRRCYVEQFYAAIDWGDRRQVDRFLRVVEAVLDATSDESRVHLLRLLARDGITCDDVGRLRPRWVGTAVEAVAGLPPESAIPVLVNRMWDSVDSDPDAAIGAAKEAIEATAKHLLISAGETVTATEKMPSLIARTQKLLDVHPTSVAPTKAGADTIKAVLGALSRAALGVNDLRRDYSTGHGRPHLHSGLTARHARLAVQAADAWVRFMLDTAQARNPDGASPPDPS